MSNQEAERSVGKSNADIARSFCSGWPDIEGHILALVSLLDAKDAETFAERQKREVVEASVKLYRDTALHLEAELAEARKEIEHQKGLKESWEKHSSEFAETRNNELAHLTSLLVRAEEALKKGRSFASKELNSGAAPWYADECAKVRYILNVALGEIQSHLKGVDDEARGK